MVPTSGRSLRKATGLGKRYRVLFNISQIRVSA